MASRTWHSPDEVEIQWPGPSKQVDRLTAFPMNRYLRVVEGQGIVG